MNILVLGSGGREHALSWKMSQSPLCDNLYIGPGNAGTSSVGQNVVLSLSDFEKISTFIIENEIGLVVVGPEQPLVDGITDFLEEKHKDLIVIGPGKHGAILEGSKAFAKEFMNQYDIPTAAYIEVTHKNIEEGIKHINNNKGPYVLKADGLAAGKGVLIIKERKEATTELRTMLSGKFGDASNKVVIEEFLDGIEFSVFVLTDGSDYVILPQAKDYKRIGEGDTGLNTGGMGAISPVPFIDEAMMNIVEETIIKPTINGLSDRGMRYQGFVFIGLILVDNSPKVIEYNCRMGDPETQVVIPRLENDLVNLFMATAQGKLNEQIIDSKAESAATIVCASGGYPESYKKGYDVKGIQKITESIVFHAGTKKSADLDNNTTITSGGRVVAVTSYGRDKDEAVSKSLRSIEKIEFKDMYHRKDIGFDL